MDNTFDPQFLGYGAEGPEFLIDDKTADDVERQGGFVVRARDMFQPGRVEKEGVKWAMYWMQWYASRRN